MSLWELLQRFFGRGNKSLVDIIASVEEAGARTERKLLDALKDSERRCETRLDKQESAIEKVREIVADTKEQVAELRGRQRSQDIADTRSDVRVDASTRFDGPVSGGVKIADKIEER